MCLIIYCPKGSDKKEKFLEEAIRKASEFNQDGMGYAIKRKDNTLFINKGFFEVDGFVKAIQEEKVRKDEELLIHLRIGNKGEKSPRMCHPFIVSSEEEEILSVLEGTVDKPILAHNGTMLRHAVTNSDKSDTFFFIKNVLSKQPVLNFLKEDVSIFNEVMQPHLAASRLVVLYPDQQDTALLGKFHKIEGLYFSKDYHEEYFPKPKTTNNYYNYYDNREYWRNKEIDYSFNEINGYDDDYIPSIKSKAKSSQNCSIKPNTILVPPLTYGRASFNDAWGYMHTNYMGLYLPEDENLRQYTVEITEDNYVSAIIDVIDSDYQAGIFRGQQYDIHAVDEDKIHLYNVSNDYNMSITKQTFYECFSVRFLGSDATYYADYFKLVRDFPVSKNLFKKLNDLYNKAIEKDFDYVNIKHNGVEVKLVETTLLAEFIDNMEKELDLRKNPHKVLF